MIDVKEAPRPVTQAKTMTLKSGQSTITLKAGVKPNETLIELTWKEQSTRKPRKRTIRLEGRTRAKLIETLLDHHEQQYG